MKSHPWFANIDWDAISRKEPRAPFIPDVSGENQYAGFDEGFTQEAPVHSYVEHNQMVDEVDH